MEQEYETIDLREIFLLIKKNIVWIVLSIVLGAVLGYIGTVLFMTPQYEASATMIVNSREDMAAQTVVTNDQIVSAKQLVETYSVILKSDTVLDQTIAELELNITYEELVEKVSISAVNSTQVMRIAVKDADAGLAQKIVESIVLQAPDIIGRTVNAGSVEVISAPKAGHMPVSPNKNMNVALAGLLGCVLCLGIVFLKTMLNNKIMTDTDITKKLGLPVLGVIPQVDIKE